MASSYIIALVILIVISIIYTIACCPSKTAPETFDVRDSANVRYGIHPSNLSCPGNSPCLATNAFRAHEENCRAMGGSPARSNKERIMRQSGQDISNTPREWMSCGMQVAPADVAKYGIGPRSSCADHPIIVRTSGRTCRAIEGLPIGFPADEEVANCQLGVCAANKAKLRLAPINSPSIGTIFINSESREKCRLMGGRPLSNGRCELGIL